MFFLYGFLGFFGVVLLVFLAGTAPEIFGKNKKQLQTGIIFVVSLFVVVFIFKKGDVNFEVKELAPYIFAPLLGLYAYFFTDKGYKKVLPAIVVTVATAVAIYLWIHPEVLRNATDPIVNSGKTKEIIAGSDYKLYALTAMILFVLVLTGYPYLAIIIFIGLLFLW
jgi:hypothetical protein